MPVSGGDGRMSGNVPNESGEFPGDGRQHTGLGFAGLGEGAIPGAKPCLRLPADIADRLAQVFSALEMMT